MRCPGTEQKNLYVPALRSSVNSFVPPWKVGVAPTILPAEDSIVMLCPSGDMFVKSIETLPALALSVVLLYLSWPSALASRLSAPLGEVLDDVDVLAVLELVGVLGVVAGAVVEELVLEEPPQPASASTPTARVTAASVGIECFLSRLCAWKLTSQVLQR